jgi:hypothetical protein
MDEEVLDAPVEVNSVSVDRADSSWLLVEARN